MVAEVVVVVAVAVTEVVAVAEVVSPALAEACRSSTRFTFEFVANHALLIALKLS